jgi:hypothetical protein
VEGHPVCTKHERRKIGEAEAIALARSLTAREVGLPKQEIIKSLQVPTT